MLEGLGTLEGCTSRGTRQKLMRKALGCLLGSIRDGDGG